jgi:transketolase
MRALTDLVVLAPGDPAQTRGAMRWAAGAGRPAYMRIGRFKVPAVTPEGAPFEVGRATVLRQGGDVTLIAAGVMVSRALEAADRLAAEGVAARMLNMATIAPLDETAVIAAAAETGRIVTAEEAIVTGGLVPPSPRPWYGTGRCRCASWGSLTSCRPAARNSCSTTSS